MDTISEIDFEFFFTTIIVIVLRTAHSGLGIAFAELQQRAA
jgi:hypothetical protein